MKANSTNILIEDCDFYTGLGVAIGSISQYSKSSDATFVLHIAYKLFHRRRLRDYRERHRPQHPHQ